MTRDCYCDERIGDCDACKAASRDERERQDARVAKFWRDKEARLKSAAAPTEGATMKDSHGQTGKCKCGHEKQRHMSGTGICMYCSMCIEYVADSGGKPAPTTVQDRKCNCGKLESEHTGKHKMCPNHGYTFSPKPVQDYREYTADEILHGIVKFTEQAGWGDPANLGHWLGAAQRWALKEARRG